MNEPTEKDLSRTGRLSAEPAVARAFLDQTLDPATGLLTLDRRGRIWEAVAAAHERGATGAGRCVAVIDGGFDLSLPELQRLIHPASFVRADNMESTGGHGSVVALLIRAIAPEVTLLLLDVAASRNIVRADVAAAIATAKAAGAQVLNLSLELPSSCPTQDTSWIDVDLLTTTQPPLDPYLAQVQEWMTHSEPYSGARCPDYCSVCDALATLDPGTLVVAASGNRESNACPACCGPVVGVGFHSTHLVEAGGVAFNVSGPPRTTADRLRAELVVEEPPHFLGTSFAAPLLAGLGVLVEVPGDLPGLAWMERAMTPVLLLGNALARAGAENAQGFDAMGKGLQMLAAAVPASHQHWESETPDGPCGVCTFFLTDWYDAWISLAIGAGRLDDALRWARLAATLAPGVATIASNRGLAAERAARSVQDPVQTKALLTEALESFTRATQIADLAMYDDAAARVTALLSPDG